MNAESTVLRSDHEYNVNVVKTNVKCFDLTTSANLFLGRLCFLAPYLLSLYKYKNVIKEQYNKCSETHINVCLLETK